MNVESRLSASRSVAVASGHGGKHRLSQSLFPHTLRKDLFTTTTKKTTALRQRMTEDLQLAGFSERTQYAYVRAVRKLAAHYGQSPDQLTEAQVRDYLLFLKNDRKFSPSALKIAHSGIKFFYSHTVVRDWATLLKLRVPRHKMLPDVLSIDEVHRLLDAVRTPHNRAFLWTVYSLGLRLQEALALQVGDIDSARMLVHVHRGKGAKDRFVPLGRRQLPSRETMLKSPTFRFDGDSRNRQLSLRLVRRGFFLRERSRNQDACQLSPSEALRQASI